MTSPTPAIALDLGGSHCSLALVQGASLLEVREIPLDARLGLAQLLPRLREGILALLQAHSLQPQQCLGLAFCVPSLVASNRILSANDKYPDAVEVDLVGWARESFGLPLAIENDARAALLGEVVAGAARGISDVLMLTLGTGIGSAMLVGGEPFRTSQAQGGNLGGHIPVALHGRLCTCGAVGCMEAEASSWALAAFAPEWPGFAASSLAAHPVVTFKLLFAAAAAGDSVARAIAQHCIHVWAVGTVGLIHAYGPQMVVFGGGVMQSAAAILPDLTAYVDRHAWTPSGRVRIVPAALGNHGALFAAIPLLQHHLKGNA